MMSKIQIKNVRLSFPNLDHREIYAGKEGKYGASFLIKKDDKENMAKINKAIKDLKDSFAKVHIAKDKICIRDGDDLKYEGCAGNYVIKATNITKPRLVNSTKKEITEEGIFYSGCYVNAIIDLWLQNNQFGTRINANLHGVQFWEDGEPLTVQHKADIDEFDEYKEDPFDNSIGDEEDNIFN